MKKFFAVLIAVAFGLNAVAQEGIKKEPAPSQQASDKATVNSIAMKDGKVWLMKGTEKTLVTSEAAVGETKVMSDGSITFKDGTKAVLKEGEKINAEGKLIRARSANKATETEKTPDKMK